MKKAIAVLAVLIVCAGLAAAAWFFLNGAENAPSDPQGSDEPNTSSTSDSSETTSSTLYESEATSGTTGSEAADSDPDAEGGSSGVARYIEVTVSEDKYFYENHEISYDDLIKVLDGLDENTAVRISDEDATLKAYENLTNALEEREILFEAAN